jgi:branched-chain amino acid transport system substrate-binding protein
MATHFRRRRVLAGAGSLGVLALAARPARAADPIRLCAVNPYTGPMALYGDETTRGYELAADEANQAGGVAGRQVQVVRGDAGTPQQGIAVVDQYASQVDLFIGTYVSAVSNAASDAALRYSKLYWDTNALALELTERGLPNFVRSGLYAPSFAQAGDDIVRSVIAPALKRTPGEMTVWIEHEDSIFGTSIARGAAERLKAAGVKVLGTGAHSVHAIDLNDAVLRIKRADPDVLVAITYVPDGNLLLRSMRDMGYKPRARLGLATGDTDETLQAVGKDTLDGMLVSSYPRWDTRESYAPGARRYLQAYKARYQRDPIAPQGMTAYVGAQMLFAAIKAAGSTDMAAVRDAAARMDVPLHSYATGWGVKFDDHMQNQRTAPTAVQWQAGKAVTVFPAEAALPGVALAPL